MLLSGATRGDRRRERERRALTTSGRLFRQAHGLRNIETNPGSTRRTETKVNRRKTRTATRMQVKEQHGDALEESTAKCLQVAKDLGQRSEVGQGAVGRKQGRG